MALVRVMTVRDWKRRQHAMSSEEIGRKRRKPKRRHRMEGARRRPRRHRVGAERRPRPRRKEPWSQAVKLGENIEIRAKAPYRAASLEVKPGLFVVGELRSDALEFGAGALDVTKSLLQAASKGVDALSSATSKGRKTSSSRSSSNAYQRKLAALKQREMALQIREARVQQAEQRLARCYAAAMEPGSGGVPLKREAVRWMGDGDLLGEDLAGDGGSTVPVRYEEPYSLEYLLWQLNKDDE